MMPSCDQTGVPGLVGLTHFHSSTTSGSAFLMSVRILLRVSPRQSPSSVIRFEMSSDADPAWLASDFFMSSSYRGDPRGFRSLAAPLGGIRQREQIQTAEQEHRER